MQYKFNLNPVMFSPHHHYHQSLPHAGVAYMCKCECECFRRGDDLLFAGATFRSRTACEKWHKRDQNVARCQLSTTSTQQLLHSTTSSVSSLSIQNQMHLLTHTPAYTHRDRQSCSTAAVLFLKRLQAGGL